MSGFIPTSKAYRADSNACGDRLIFEVSIVEVGPVHRAPGIGIFNDNDEAPARERVKSILNGFRSGAAIPPVEVVRQPTSAEFRYKLVAGAHRFYCSLAAGFSHVPAVRGLILMH
jgi:hypothetical protein